MNENIDEPKVVSLSGAREKSKENKSEPIEEEAVYCSFCGRPNYQVVKMIQGPDVNICSECVMVCVQYLILQDRVPSSESQKILDSFWRGVKK